MSNLVPPFFEKIEPWKGQLHEGGVAEWSKAAVLKTAVPQGTVGSNPSSSAALRRDNAGANHSKPIVIKEVTEWPKVTAC